MYLLRMTLWELDNMPSIKELGQRIKAKYPKAYDDLSDDEAGRLIKAKYPTEYADYEDPPMLLQGETMCRYQAQMDKVPIDLLEKVVKYYNPKRGRLTSWWQRGRAESRGRLLTALNEEQVLVIQQGAVLEGHIRLGLQNEAAFRVFIAQNAAVLNEIRAKQDLIEKALEEGLTLESQQSILVEQRLAESRLNEEARRSQLKIEEHQRLSEIDIEKDYKMRMNQLKGILAVKVFSYDMLKELRGKIQKLLEERHEVATGEFPEGVKKEYLKLLDNTIKTHTEAYRVGENRLLETNNREELGGVDEESEL